MESDFVGLATDSEWWLETFSDAEIGQCGGCGTKSCHKTQCVDDYYGYCKMCPDRGY